jgi:hypothetical protein
MNCGISLTATLSQSLKEIRSTCVQDADSPMRLFKQELEDVRGIKYCGGLLYSPQEESEGLIRSPFLSSLYVAYPSS